MRARPPIWGLIALLVGLCVTQAIRLTERGTPVADAVTAIVVVVALVTGLPLLLFVLLGSRNRRLLSKLRESGAASDELFAIFYSKELRSAIQPFSAITAVFNRHGVMQINRSGIAIWSARKQGPPTPALVARLPLDEISAVTEETIPIEGGDFWGLSVEVLTPDANAVVLLPIGLANRRAGAFFPSRREASRSRAQILALISPIASIDFEK